MMSGQVIVGGDSCGSARVAVFVSSVAAPAIGMRR